MTSEEFNMKIHDLPYIYNICPFSDEEDKSISFDIIIDFKVKNREEVYQEIYDEIQSKYKDYKISITLDIDISD